MLACPTAENIDVSVWAERVASLAVYANPLQHKRMHVPYGRQDKHTTESAIQHAPLTCPPEGFSKKQGLAYGALNEMCETYGSGVESKQLVVTDEKLQMYGTYPPESL